jgi:uncharacterized protein GlcG (DUF336 family)
MFQRPALNFDQVQAAMAAMIARAKQKPVQSVAIAIVDDAGNLLAYACMDNVRLFARRHAIRKAYTAAVVGMDTGAHGERLKASGRTVSDLGGDPNLTPGSGGVVVRSKEGVILGGIGVGGIPPGGEFTDEDLARIGLRDLDL